MAIQYKFFIISVKNQLEAEEEFNRFLRSGNIINITKEFVPQGDNSFWYMAVEYHTGAGTSTPEKRARIDYREILSPEDFALYAKLREWRKDVAEKEGTQLFNVFTNDQMAKIAEKKIVSAEGLKRISGVGDARIKKYGAAVIKIVQEETRPQKENEPGKEKPGE
jgi:superfamily II DNA helicase RecQ